MKDSTKKIKNKKWRKPPGPFKNSSLVEWLLLNQADPVIHPLVLTGRWTLDGNVNFAPGNRKGSKLLQLSYSNLGIMLLDTKWGCPLHYQKKKKKKRKNKWPRERHLMIFVQQAPKTWNQKFIPFTENQTSFIL